MHNLIEVCVISEYLMDISSNQTKNIGRDFACYRCVESFNNLEVSI